MGHKKPGSLLDCSIGFYLAAWNADAVYSDENSVSPSVRLSNAWIVTKRKKDRSRFLYHTKDHLA